VPHNLTFEQLKEKYLELQLRVTQFSGVEQELINTQDKLDQELVLYKRLNEFNRSALSQLSESEFSRLAVESVIDILELEGALILFFCNENNGKTRLEVEGISEHPNPSFTEELSDYFVSEKNENKGKTIHFHDSAQFPTLNIDFSECLYYMQAEKNSGGGVLILSWVSKENAPLYKQISSREKNVFSIFCQQVFSLYINRLKNEKITQQIEQISASQLELKKLSLIATKTKNGVIISNNKGEIEWVNDAFTHITGYELNEIKGLKPKSFLHPENPDLEKIELLQRKLAQKEGVQVTLMNKTKDNSLYYNQLEIIPIFDDQGNHINFIALQRDITEEVESKEEILRINSRFELISQNAKIGIWESRTKDGILSWNSILFDQFGIKESEAKNIRDIWMNCIQKEDKERVEKAIAEIREGKVDKQEINFRIIQKNTGEIRHLRCLIMAERDQQGDLIRLVGSSIDQTEEVNYLREIEEGKKKIERINKNLEKMVQEKTQSNLDLAKTISDQEKLVTIGEIAAGIAHDLNTPLGSIKVGAESIRSTLEDLFKDTLHECTLDQIEFACNRAMNNKFELFVGGLQKRKEMSVLSQALQVIEHEDFQNLELLDSLVRCRFSPENMVEIKTILATKNKASFLRLIYQLQSLRSFIDTILTSSDRASKVVQDMRNYIKDKRQEEKNQVQLSENISTVLTIFNFELKRKADIIFEVPDNLFIKGLDVHLFQLWANIIKNAAEAFETYDPKNYIKIDAEEKDGFIIVNLENNGPMIPQEIRDKIFQKFYTTKSKKNGTGLGLSIIRKIVDEHNGKISIHSDEEKTIFSIYFPITEQ
jgi:PAS domain S-box-containing protein